MPITRSRRNAWQVYLQRSTRVISTIAAVLGIILGEACLISVAGGFLGFVISTFLMRGVKNSPFGGFLPALPLIQPGVMLTCLAIAATIGVLSSFVPAWGASRTPIVQALRSTD